MNETWPKNLSSLLVERVRAWFVGNGHGFKLWRSPFKRVFPMDTLTILGYPCAWKPWLGAESLPIFLHFGTSFLVQRNLQNHHNLPSLPIFLGENPSSKWDQHIFLELLPKSFWLMSTGFWWGSPDLFFSRQSVSCEKRGEKHPLRELVQLTWHWMPQKNQEFDLESR